ncbi:MAG: HypC/HybG/HupF family hydrogenase formation chaperone [Chloroflexi bacterium]|nr:HypC/HybG/HupF family hydrogenase formation chaperone [Chloroflexota bacterium]
MCVAVPGQVVQIEENAGVRIGRVSFGDTTKQVMLALVPDVRVGDFVMVEAGLATVKVEKEQADEILKFIKELDELT